MNPKQMEHGKPCDVEYLLIYKMYKPTTTYQDNLINASSPQPVRYGVTNCRGAAVVYARKPRRIASDQYLSSLWLACEFFTGDKS